MKDGDGDFRIQIPDDATVTFGPTIPYTPKEGRFGGGNHYSVRVYEGHSKDKLLAVFAGVQHFRDQVIPVERLVVRESGKSLWKSDEGGYHAETEVKHSSFWGDDLVKDGPKMLPPTKKKRK